MRAAFETAATVLERVSDFVTVVAGVFLSYWTYQGLHIGKQLHYSTNAVAMIGIGIALVFVLMLEREGVYARAGSLLRIRETERILRVSVFAYGLVSPVALLLSHLVSRWTFAFAIVFIPLLLTLEKQLVFNLIRYLHSRGYGLQNVLVYGAGSTGRRVFSALVRSPKLGLNPVAIVDDCKELAGQEIFQYGYRRERSVPVIAGPLTTNVIAAYRASLVIIGIPSMSREWLSKVSREAFRANANVAFVPPLSYGTETLTEYVDMDGVLIASMKKDVSKPYYEFAKRIFDVFAALALLLFTSVIWLPIALLIRFDSRGPIFFCQDRVGWRGVRFKMFKFRSMRADADKYDFHPSEAGDPRITRVGRWLRHTSLDELPQLINVLKGDMSLVGPRPEMPFIVEQYSEIHLQRLQVKPGITGLWQLSADRDFLIHENIHYDLYYIRNRNFFMDVAILLHTLLFAMRGM